MLSVVITSGRRPDLFCESIDTFRANCLDQDLIDKYICIDDGTSDEWRATLAARYPDIHFINKTVDQRGHAKSLNMIQPLLTTKYIVRLEDDWKFIVPGHFVRDACAILDENADLGQVMFNKNYQQRATDNLLGGAAATTSSGLEYFRHEYLPDPADHPAWHAKHGYGPSVLLTWPHFSLQPSVTRVAALLDTGLFGEDSSYFEYQFAHRYADRGWRTAFLPSVVCEHTGRLLNDPAGPLNAYDLLGQDHFGAPPRPHDPQNAVYKY